MKSTGAVIGLVGLGQIGTRVARIAQGFGLRVLAHDPLLDAETIRARGAEPVGLDRLLAESDFVSLHCPLDASTRGLFDARAFAAMKSGAVFISTARGGIHDEAALYDALRAGHLRGAGLDVWQQEPPARDARRCWAWLAWSPLFHTVQGVTARGAAQRRPLVRRCSSRAMLRGERPPQLVNPEAWPIASRRIADLT